MNLVALQTKSSSNYEDNLKHLESIVKELPKNSLVVAPELCLTGYSYETLDKAASFSKIAIERLLKCSEEQTIALTMTTKKRAGIIIPFIYFIKAKLFILNPKSSFLHSIKKSNILSQEKKKRFNF